MTKSLKEKWEKWLKEFSKAGSVTIGRYASVPSDCLRQLKEAKYWLHGFGDASKRACCAVVYLVTIVSKKASVKLVSKLSK